MVGDKVYIDASMDLDLHRELPEGVFEIPLGLLYLLADDSPLGGAWSMQSVPEKLADLFGLCQTDDVPPEE